MIQPGNYTSRDGRPIIVRMQYNDDQIRGIIKMKYGDVWHTCFWDAETGRISKTHEYGEDVMIQE